jgi:hypothetical protein
MTKAPSRYTRNFHGWKREYEEHSILNALSLGNLNSEDATLITEFIAEMKGNKRDQT